MAILIEQVLPKSSAAKHGIKAGETLVSVNGKSIRDFLDLQYYSSEPHLRMQVTNPEGSTRWVELERESYLPLGIEPEAYQCKSCQNSCVFCFIDQMPPSLRESLYLKDDDYIYSFVFGNYITLSNMTQADFDRIVEQHISPLYISVHSTNTLIRQKMMRYQTEIDIMQELRRLIQAGIDLHIQIVAVPGFNTGEQLSATLEDLCQFEEGVLSIGVVPVGLTKYRDQLMPLHPVDGALAKDIIQRIDYARKFYEADYIYAADEFYVLSGERLPLAWYYKDYPQVENGIGMLRMLLSKFPYRKARFIKELKKKNSDYKMLCSISAFATINSICCSLQAGLDGQRVSCEAIRNDFCGPQISVAGLLTFSDFKAQAVLKDNEIPIIPEIIFNSDGLTLDGASIEDFRALWQRDILVINQFFTDWGWE